jgi:hypothetical protein
LQAIDLFNGFERGRGFLAAYWFEASHLVIHQNAVILHAEHQHRTPKSSIDFSL